MAMEELQESQRSSAKSFRMSGQFMNHREWKTWNKKGTGILLFQREVYPSVVFQYIMMMCNSSEHQQNEKSDYANSFAIGWIFILEWAERPLASDRSCECSDSACNARVCGLLGWTSWIVTIFSIVPFQDFYTFIFYSSYSRCSPKAHHGLNRHNP